MVEFLGDILEKILFSLIWISYSTLNNLSVTDCRVSETIWESL